MLRAQPLAGTRAPVRICQKESLAPLRRTFLAFDPLPARHRLLAGIRAAAASGASSTGDNSPSAGGDVSSSNGSLYGSQENSTMADNFCIIESRDAVKDFEGLAIDELRQNLAGRRNRIFLLMEEVRRLRIQLRLKGGDVDKVQDLKEERFMSALPFLPPLNQESLNKYYTVYFFLFAAIITFGGLAAPLLEIELGLGGTSYLDFVEGVGLPSQLADVDPIVASFCGGSVGVLSALLVVEINNMKVQQKNRCHYCEGTGYLQCGQCIGAGVDPTAPEPATTSSASVSASGNNSAAGPISMRSGRPTARRTTLRACACCSGTGKVMCTGCLCTGKQMATEHDPRIDPFD